MNWVHAGLLIAVSMTWALGQGPETDIEQALARYSTYQDQISKARDLGMNGNEEAASQALATAQESLEESLALFESAGAADSDDARVLQSHAEALAAHGDNDLAAEALKRATDLTPEAPEIWLALAQNLIVLGPSRNDDALEAIRAVLSLEPAQPIATEAHLLLAGIYRRTSLYDFALEEYEQVLALDPENLAARMGKAILGIRTGGVVEASRTFDELGAIPPELSTPANDMLEAMLRDFSELRVWLPDDAAHHLAYAKLLIRVSMLQESVAPLVRVTQLAPDNYVAYNFLGFVRGALGAVDEAIEAYEASLRINPGQPRTREIIESLKNPPKQPAPSEPAGAQTGQT